MEKTTRRNIMEIYEGWRISRKILKRDLALDRTSGRWRMALSGRRICSLGHPDGWWPYPLEFLDRLLIDQNQKVVGAKPEWSEPIP